MRELECTVAIDIYMSETAARWPTTSCRRDVARARGLPGLPREPAHRALRAVDRAVIPKQGEAKEEWEIFTLLGDAMGLTYLEPGRALAPPRAPARRPRLLAALDHRRHDPRRPAGRPVPAVAERLERGALAARRTASGWASSRTGILGEKLMTRGQAHPSAETRHRARGGAPPREAACRPERRVPVPADRPARSPLEQQLAAQRPEAHARRPRPAAPRPPRRRRAARPRRRRSCACRSRVGAVDAEVRVSDELMPGVVSLPHGWSDGVETHRRVAPSWAADPTATT